MAKYEGPSFVLELSMKAVKYDVVKLNNIFDISLTFYNQMLRETLKRYYLLEQDKRYQKTLRQIIGVSKKLTN